MTDTLPQLLSLSDIVSRWVYTRQGVQKLMREDPEFPKAVMTVSRGKVRLWLARDIDAYAHERPWVTDEESKWLHQRYAFGRYRYGSKLDEV